MNHALESVVPTPATLLADALKPYCSFLLLQDTLASSSLPQWTAISLIEELDLPSADTRELVGLGGWTDAAGGADLTWSAAGYRRERTPSWLTGDQPWVDVTHELVLVGRWRRFVIVHADASLLDAIRTRIRDGRIRRYLQIPALVIEAALVTGDIRTAHLASTQRRRRTKPDAKVLTGVAVQDSMNPGTDASYALSSVRAEASALFGSDETIGVTPSRSSIWVRRCPDFPHFSGLVAVIVRAIAAAITNPSLSSAVPFLAAEIDSLDGVDRPFDITTTSSTALPEDASDELRQAAEILDRVSFAVEGVTRGGADFRVEACYEGQVAVDAVGHMRRDRGETLLSFDSTRLMDPQLQHVWDAMRHKELLVVHYGSGHTWLDGRMYRSEMRDARFPNWRWGDFTGVDVTAEKPLRRRSDGQAPVYDPALIATEGDRSLFGWVVRTLGGDGYITCDDGPGEVADFVCVDDAGRLHVVHVKAAFSSSPRRRFAATTLEQVVAQATKNLARITVPAVVDALRLRPHAATWCCGEPDPSGRGDMLDYVETVADKGAPVDVIVVQPHLVADAYQRGLAARGEENLRVRLGESLLLGARSAVTSLAGDLYVYGAAAA